ncbi:basic proline-rich protein-like [Oreochromis niloticus]|uniref:basic proline-rich protein-like n=1 Tax=Oreochromis niloticus TaxID=8128 RepID=UPI000DF33198|nr:basic proline-rich protein-like [Oreochromis niloticus]
MPRLLGARGARPASCHVSWGPEEPVRPPPAAPSPAESTQSPGPASPSSGPASASAKPLSMSAGGARPATCHVRRRVRGPVRPSLPAAPPSAAPTPSPAAPPSAAPAPSPASPSPGPASSAGESKQPVWPPASSGPAKPRPRPAPSGPTKPRPRPAPAKPSAGRPPEPQRRFLPRGRPPELMNCGLLCCGPPGRPPDLCFDFCHVLQCFPVSCFVSCSGPSVLVPRPGSVVRFLVWGCLEPALGGGVVSWSWVMRPSVLSFSLFGCLFRFIKLFQLICNYITLVFSLSCPSCVLCLCLLCCQVLVVISAIFPSTQSPWFCVYVSCFMSMQLG